MRGVTLIEMMIALMILGLLAGISGLALSSLPSPNRADPMQTRRATRARAVLDGAPTEYLPANDSAGYRDPIVFLPDGRALGSGVDPLTGRTHATR